MGTLIIRADASKEIGFGHVMRCLALAQAWQDTDGKVTFVMAGADPGIQQRLRNERMEVVRVDAATGSAVDAEQTCKIALSHGAEWCVLDGYQFDHPYRSRLRAHLRRMLLVDDHGESFPYDCDLLLNVNVYAAPEMYAGLPQHARSLLGTKYALLRREFLGLSENHKIPNIASRILVTFGGSDPHNVSLLVLNALSHLSITRFEVAIVVGSANPHLAALKARAAELQFPVRVLSNVSNMPELMDWADLGISAGGGTCLEFAIRKVPMLLIIMASNHERTVESFQQLGAAVSPGWFHALNEDRLARCLQEVITNADLRERIREHAAKLIDGAGASRVVKAMYEVAAEPRQR